MLFVLPTIIAAARTRGEPAATTLSPVARGYDPMQVTPQDERPNQTWDGATDYGEPFAASQPLIGRSMPYVWADNVRIKQPHWACASLQAAVDKHAFWFSGAPNSQQSELYNFLDALPTKLCARASTQSEHEYTTILHGMLQTVREAISKHVHSAFWIKELCNVLDDPCLDVSAMYGVYAEEVTVADTCDTPWAAAVSCMTVMLAHEKFNLVEGYHFLNMSYAMLEQGNSFCTAPGFEERLKEVNAGMEDTMAYHRSNVAFEELAESHFEVLCTEPGNASTYDAAYAKMDAMLDENIMTDTDCVLDDDVFQGMKWLKNNPPHVSDLVYMIETNTQFAVAAATELVESILGREACLADDGKLDEPTSKSLLAKLEAANLPESTYSAMHVKEGHASPRTSYASMPSIYHKISPTCMPFWENHTWAYMCVDDTGTMYQSCTEGSITHNVPVFDIGTSTDITQCHGEKCKAAARAVMRYQDMLAPLTSMRWNMHTMTHGVPPDLDYKIMNQSTWVFQRSCAAFTNMVDSALALADMLPGVIAALRAATPQLSTSCIAPPRKWPLEFPDEFAYTATDSCLVVAPADQYTSLRHGRSVRKAAKLALNGEQGTPRPRGA